MAGKRGGVHKSKERAHLGGVLWKGGEESGVQFWGWLLCFLSQYTYCKTRGREQVWSDDRPPGVKQILRKRDVQYFTSLCGRRTEVKKTVIVPETLVLMDRNILPEERGVRLSMSRDLHSPNPGEAQVLERWKAAANHLLSRT
ncbi:hypothetical protein WMY93_017006 [Mugilogobius chulae]|uniref:Uncharacterized protein n=1 Tax=Mugilogobius chulae TaxID=88201 RepID=A0AAW0NZ69_9GOBI